MTTGSLFGTDGIRGLAGQWPLTPDFVMRLGQAIGGMLCADAAHPQVAIGRDTRCSGPTLEQALTGGLLSVGVDTHHLGVIPTPAVAYLTQRWQLQAGIVITASHNPYCDNGIKLFGPQGNKLAGEAERRIQCLTATQTPAADPDRPGHSFQRPEGQEVYRAFLLDTCLEERPLEGMSLLLDCADGATSTLAPELLGALGARCLAQHAEPDGRNINTSYEYITPRRLAREVIAQGVDLGIALDGDGDRVVFVAEQGGFVDGDGTLAILAREMQSGGTLAQDTVVATVMSNLGLEISLRQAGIHLVRTPVGDRHVTERMVAGGFSLGGEQAGHIVMTDQGHISGDGIYTALRLCQALRHHEAPLSELAACMRTLPQVLISVPVRCQPPWEDLRTVRDLVSAAEDILGDQGRVVVRYSGTEPLARVMIEGPEQQLIERLAAGIAEAFRQEVGAAT